MQPSQCHGFVCGLQTVSAHRHWSDGACSFPQENPAVTTESTPYASAPDSGRVGASLLSSRPFTPYQLSTRVFAVIIALSVTALSISGYLAWSAFTASDVAGCGGGEVFDCGHVLNSQYAKVLGIPVSAPSFGLYASILGVLLIVRRSAPEELMKRVWMLLTFGGISAGLAAIWFIGVQVFALEHLCPWCLGAHACGLILAGIVLWKRPLNPSTTCGLGSMAAVGMALMITLQVTSDPPETFVVEEYGNDEVVDDEDAEGGTFAPPTTFEPPGGDLFAPPVTDNELASPAGAIEGDSADIEEEVTEQTRPEETPAVTTDDESQSSVSEQHPLTAAVGTALLLNPQAMLITHLIAIQDEDDAEAKADEKNTDEKNTDEKNTDEKKADEKKADEKKADEKKENLASIRGDKYRLNTRHWPLLGAPDARYVFVEMFDYTCPHCRTTHKAIDGAFRKYGKDLAVIALPVPLDGSCNNTVRSTGSHRGACELARIAIAVWRVDASKFKEFHDWMFEKRRTIAAAKDRAEKLVGKSELKAELAQPHAKNYILKHVELYKALGKGSVPKLMFPNATLTGSVASADTLIRTIEKELVD